MSKYNELIKNFIELKKDPNLSEEMRESLKVSLRIAMNPECINCCYNILNDKNCTGQNSSTPCILFQPIK